MGDGSKSGDALDDIAISGEELLAIGANEAPCIVEGLLAQEDFVLLSGREKESLKTWLALDLALAMRTGSAWLGHKVERCEDPALIISETRPSILAPRIAMLCRGRALDVREVVKGIVVTGEPISVVPIADLERISREATAKARNTHAKDSLERAVESGKRAALGSGRNLAALIALLQRKWSLVAIDTLRLCLLGDENNSEAASKFTAGAREIARRTGAIVFATHHTSKGSMGGDARSARGSVELTAGPDALLTVDTDGGRDPRVHFTLRAREAPDAQAYRLVTGGEGSNMWARIELSDPAAPPRRRNEAGIVDAVLGTIRIEQEVTANQIRTAVGISGSRLVDVLRELMRERRITQRRSLRNGKRVDIYSLDPRGQSWSETLSTSGQNSKEEFR